jgi:SOS-response transcriptional repressor LexA
MSEHDVVIQILKLAHQRMDQRGYPPVTRPIDDRGCNSSGNPCSNLGGHTSEPGALKRPGSDRNPLEVPMSVHSTRRVNPQHKAGAA